MGCSMTVKCEIIIVKYGLPKLEAECVASVEEHTQDVDYVLTAHDNYDADESLSKVWNDLIRASDAEYLCLLNNDTRVEAKWLSKLLECFDDEVKLGAVGPMTNSCSGPQGKLRKNRTSYKRTMNAKYPLVGFCLVFPKAIWEEVGGFDEAYELYGEDSDFMNKVMEKGYAAQVRTDVFIFHHGKASTPIAEARGKDMKAIREASKERYKERWTRPKAKAAAEKLARKKAAKEAAEEAQRKEETETRNIEIAQQNIAIAHQKYRMRKKRGLRR